MEKHYKKNIQEKINVLLSQMQSCTKSVPALENPWSKISFSYA